MKMTTVAQAELDSMTDFQKELHETKEGEDIASNFYNEFIRSTWYVNSLVKFKHNKVSENQIDYSYHDPCGFLLYSEMIQKLPELSVKDEFARGIRIAWTPNIAFNIIDNAKLTIGDVETMNLTNISIEQYYQYCRTTSEETLKRQTGDIPVLTDFSSRLPSYSTILVHPWFYKDSARKLPMFDGIGKTVIHSYKLRNRIDSLLRMQELVGDVWTNIQPNLSYLEGIPPDKCLTSPEFWGKVSYNSKDELNYNRCESTIDIYYRDYITVSAPNSEKLGKKIVIDNMTRLPCRSLWWVAQNVDALEYNYYSNYTTNSADRTKNAFSPIKAYSIYHGTHLRKIEDMDTTHSEIIEPMMHYKSQPIGVGFGACAISLDPLNNNDVGLSFGDLKTRFIGMLGSANNLARETNNTAYNFHLTLMVQRKITFERSKNPLKDSSEYNVYVDRLSKNETEN